jgi:hypothetical protein
MKADASPIPLYYRRLSEDRSCKKIRHGGLYAVAKRKHQVLFTQIFLVTLLFNIYTNYQTSTLTSDFFYQRRNNRGSPTGRQLNQYEEIDYIRKYRLEKPSHSRLLSEIVDYAMDYYDLNGSLTLSQRSSTSNTVALEDVDPWMMQESNSHKYQTDRLQKERREQRKQNSRPPPTSILDIEEARYTSLHNRQDKMAYDTTPLDGGIAAVMKQPLPKSNQTMGSPSTAWIQGLCQKAQLTKTSRVVIINPLTTQLSTDTSSTLGTASLFTLFIAKYCEVKNIFIADSMLPNTKKFRLQSMNTFRTLYRDIENLQLIVPLATAGLARKEDEDLEVKWLKNFSPTHVLHFENANHRETELWDEYLTTKGQQLYHIKNSILTMQQLMHHCDERSKSGASNGKFKVANKIDSLVFLHVAMTDHWEDNEKNTDPVYSMMADYYHKMAKNGANKGNVHLHQLQIPSYSSQLVYDDEQTNFFSLPNEHLLSIDNHEVLPMITGIMHALQPEETQRRRRMSISSQISAARNEISVAASIDDSHDFYGIVKTPFPCASSCNTPRGDAQRGTVCTPSVLDSVSQVSTTITSDCTYVVYTVMGNAEDDSRGPLKLRVKSEGKSNKVCRIVFGSSKHPLIQRELQQIFNKNSTLINDLNSYNGKVESTDGSWKFVLFPEPELADTDVSLFRIEPSQLFSSNVQKAMYVSNTSSNLTASVSDDDLFHILSSLDYVENQVREPTIEYRSGKPDVFRTLEPPTSPRTVLLHSDEAPNAPAAFGEYIEWIGREKNLKIQLYRQLAYYKQMNQFVQLGDNRPPDEMGPGAFKTPFPWQWISMESYVHDLRSDPARQLRCLWYEAHLYFGENSLIPDTEDLSLAYVIGKQRLEGYLGPNLYDDASWIPVMNRRKDQQEALLDENGEEVVEEVESISKFFIRVVEKEVIEEEETEENTAEDIAAEIK